MPSPLDPQEPKWDLASKEYQERETHALIVGLMQLSYNVAQMFGLHPLSAEGKAIAMRVLAKSMAQLVVIHKGRFISAN